jgi:tripartite-type tricarboxylate transporter receptor subunit TctC
MAHTRYFRRAVIANWKALGIACGFVFCAPCTAQPYPQKVIRYIVPGGPGSGADLLGRIVGGGIGKVFGQQVIVDNRSGAGGNIGAELAARAPRDGYTLLQISLTHALNVSLYRRLSYDLVRDFAPITQIATASYLVAVHPSLPARTISDLVKLAKARPGAINYASAGTGTPTFLAAELFKAKAGVNLVHVAYKGGGEALTSVLSGETQVYFSPVTTAAPFLGRGQLRGLGVTTLKRLAQLPQIPTVAESGYPGFQSGNWYGLMAPAVTPPEIITAIREATLTALRDPAIDKRLTDLGFVPLGDTSQEFSAHLKAEVAALGKVVRDLSLSAD